MYKVYRKIILACLLLIVASTVCCQRVTQTINDGWKFSLFEGDASTADFDVSGWTDVSIPHTWNSKDAEDEIPGYFRGKGWYRKAVTVEELIAGQRVYLCFEGANQETNVFVNGKLVGNHKGGYSAFTFDVTDYVHTGRNLVAVSVDNSYNPDIAPLSADFTFFGGLYRDVYLVYTSPVQLSTTHYASSGVYLKTVGITDAQAEVCAKTFLSNALKSNQALILETEILDADGNRVALSAKKVNVKAGEKNVAFEALMTIAQPKRWDVDSPYLYKVYSRLKNKKGEVLDCVVNPLGIREYHFDAEKGFFLNGKYRKLIGTSRHQDYKGMGNALRDEMHIRDIQLSKDMGSNFLRVAHYPQDPAFMDACDEMGLFVIVATPGWQYWNKNPEFAKLVHRNTREMIRRDRNHPSVLMWEPILNETPYPRDFALEALRITWEEFPYPGRPVAAADVHSKGVAENYDVVYGWPGDDEKADRPEQCIFTREFGENVDDWYAHNNNNRASRSWGERPLLVQALSLSKSYDEMYRTTGQFVGGAQWHPFDHQRGYHPDPYFGGIYDAFRQPKYAYYAFRSQSAATLKHPVAECGPMVFIAHEMSPFSDADVVVFSNCDSVRLSVYDGTESRTLPVVHAQGHMPNAPVIFKDVWDFWEAREYSYKQKNWQKVNMVAEGIIDGKVVCTYKRMPSRRSTKLRMYVDTEGKQLVADGSDFIVVVAEVTDDSGNVRRLAKENIVFTVEGEGRVIGDASINANPRTVEFGSAPVLIRSTRKPGKIKVKAHVQFEGTNAPVATEIELESIPSELPFCYTEEETDAQSAGAGLAGSPVRTERMAGKVVLTEEERQKVLMEVERQQTEFGTEK